MAIAVCLTLAIYMLQPVVADDADKWIQYSKDPNPAVRSSAIYALGKTNDARAVEPDNGRLSHDLLA